VCDNPDVMVHPTDTYAWKEIDAFDSSFGSEARNVHIGLAIDGFSPFNLNVSSYSCWPMFAIPYNLLPALCINFDFCCVL
jgi:hypothetical protein